MYKLFLIIGMLTSVIFAAENPATHGMVIVGTHQVYAYHLPMFHNPHNYQAIFEITFDKKTMETYLKEKAQSPRTLFTLVPKPMVLPELANKPEPVIATLVKGHFEQGGKPITGPVKVGFVKTLHFTKLNAETPKMDNYHGIFFGNAKELFMAHQISGAPDFDQITQVSSNALPNPIQGSFEFAGVTNNPLGIPVSLNLAKGPIQVTEQVYLEFGDL